MPINTKGGKGCKKRKKGATNQGPVYIDRQEGQMFARALRLLGNRNVLCYGNDDILRLCHICGKMKGRVFIEPGDIVLITLRKFSDVDDKEVELGDIIAKYAPEQYSSLRKEDGANPKLFMKLETVGNISQAGKDYSKECMPLLQDDGFEFENSEEEDSDDTEDSDGVDKSRRKQDKPGHRTEANTRTTIENTGDVDVDDL